MRREEDVGFAAGSGCATRGAGVEHAEPPHAPSAPELVERAEPPDRPADVSMLPPSAAEPSDPWRFPATVSEVHVRRKHSVGCGVTEDPECRQAGSMMVSE
ncbi:hypothetical protein ILYODFUR_035065 [Ilyodon furcidens]|uniref:Uncharacterized protein n=1 Tax=Ilyodon furcidens TaxID=33524 RepID=A0ABV0UAY8_9TELE